MQTDLFRGGRGEDRGDARAKSLLGIEGGFGEKPCRLERERELLKKTLPERHDRRQNLFNP